MGNKQHNKTHKLEQLLGEDLGNELYYSIPRSQAERVLWKFNGARELCRMLAHLDVHIAPSTIYKWTYPKEKGGTGGIIPTANWPAIIKAAKYAGVYLDIDDYDPRVMKFKKPDSKVRIKLLRAQGYGHR